MTVRRGLRRNLRRPIRRSLTGRAGLEPDPEIHFNKDSFVGNPVTTFINVGTGGPSLDLTAVLGTAANLTTTTLNGVPSVNFGVGVNIKTENTTVLSGIGTEYLVIKMVDPTASVQLITGESGGQTHRTQQASSNLLWEQGGLVKSQIDHGTGTMLVVSRWAGNATSNFQIFEDGKAPIIETGDAGNQNFNAMSLFGRFDGALQGEGIFGEYAYFVNVIHTDSEVQFVKDIVLPRFGIVTI